MQYTITKNKNSFETMIRYQDGRENNSFKTLDDAEKAVIDGAKAWNGADITIDDIVYLEEVEVTMPAKQVRPSSREKLSPPKPKAKPKEKGGYVVREFDFYDGWLDISSDVSHEKAKEIWNRKTDNGKHSTKYETGGRYYSIFPSNTRMMVTPESMDR